MFYLVNTPWWIKILFPVGIWDIHSSSNTIYLTFDDGPHPQITPFVLEELRKYNAKGTFFCIGSNVEQYREIYDEILQQGHAVGNHTQDHLNGWIASDEDYLINILQAQKHIESNLFRPPYGRIKKRQAALLRRLFPQMKIIMWNVVSADFDTNINSEKCTRNVLKHAKSGSMLVFHDSEKAFPRLQKTLPVVMKELSERGFVFEKIPENLS
jgi:peptidoglycan/xylan/chitin deacetylase (PgdA/CDA1 family)